MEFIPFARCKKDLDFKPLTPYPEALYPYAHRDQLLCGFANRHTDAILCEGSEQDLFFSLFPELSLPELSRLKVSLSGLNWDWNIEKLFAYYGYRWNEQLSRVVELIPKLPKEFQDWCSHKGLGAKDFYPLLVAVPNNEYLNEFALLQASRSEGVQILELYADLTIQEKTVPEISQQRKVGEYLSQLKALRYPQRESSLKERTEKTSLLSWPKGSEVRWNGSKDIQKLEFKTAWDSKDSLDKTIKALQHVSDQMQEDEKNPWK